MRITLRKSFEIFLEEWHVPDLVVSHDHLLLPPEQVRLLPSYRHISEEDKKQIIRVIELEKQLKHGGLPFFQKDVHNFLKKIHQGNMESDGMDLLEHCKRAKEEDSRFQYAFCIFVILMKKLPKTIITDQDPWITQAIAMEMPLAKDTFCIWHITAKFSSWFTSVLRNHYPSWCATFYRLYKLNKEIGQIQLRHTMLDTCRGSSLRTLSQLEDLAYKVLTKFSFKKFQEELGRKSQYKVHDKTDMVYMVDYYKDPHAERHKVFWNVDLVTCSCKHVEFWGILCRHVLTVFIHKDCFEISARYLPLHWCCDEFHSVDAISMHSEEQTIPSNTNASTSVYEFVRCPPISTTKGRPKSKRSRGGKELAKQTKSCRLCKRSGHNITTCSDKENSDVINFRQLIQTRGRRLSKDLKT
ncbi:hypothetical protein Cgig2_003421 [Carnegiea gigantea]|uniref:Protein FAR1-RELATED SEQUENCE n=1 Tax=Carnegiea gigantea TaxID=171969 RepID=A0A9Q1K9E9_9CARY|nr:hypothetical protein Cgig2_003421 [Carnegiea gigantea]